MLPYSLMDLEIKTPSTFAPFALDNCNGSAINLSASQRSLAVPIYLNPSITSNNFLWINEFHYDNTGSDQGEFIEIAGTANTDLTGYSLVLYNGSNGTVYDSQVLVAVYLMMVMDLASL